MKKILLFWLLPILGFAAPLQNRSLDPAAVEKLATALGMAPGSDLIAETQAHWLRRPGQERWEMEELPEEKRALVLHWAEEQGLFASWKPFLSHYDIALILGATTSPMQRRLDYLAKLWNEGTRFQEIVWLTGKRPLDPRVDSLLDAAANESEAAHLIWERSSLPEEMRSLPVTFISADKPSLCNAIATWLKTSPTPGKALFLSNQPYCGYQFAVIGSCLPKEFLFDVAGPEATKVSAAVLLDTIARWLYSEKSAISMIRKK